MNAKICKTRGIWSISDPYWTNMFSNMFHHFFEQLIAAIAIRHPCSVQGDLLCCTAAVRMFFWDTNGLRGPKKPYVYICSTWDLNAKTRLRMTDVMYVYLRISTYVYMQMSQHTIHVISNSLYILHHIACETFRSIQILPQGSGLILRAAKALVSIEMGGRNPNWYRRQQEGVRNKEHSESHTTDRSMIEANASFFAEHHTCQMMERNSFWGLSWFLY